MYSLLLLVVALFCGVSHVQSFVFFRREYFEGDQSFNKSSHRDYNAMWIKQKVDHFNDNDDRTFNMKYYKNVDYWKSGGPIVLYLNGEAPLSQDSMEAGGFFQYSDGSDSLMIQICKETGGALFMLEHRYYGCSQPFEDQTTANLAFLSSKQALADAAYLLENIKKSSEFSTAKVLVIGGSYAGNLATWIKLKYPKLVDAALASSAPVLAKKNFYEYYEAVTDTFRTYGSQECVDKISKIFQNYLNLLQTADGMKKLKNLKNICDYVDMSVPENQQLFFSSELAQYALKAQYGKPQDIDTFCKEQQFNRLFQFFPVRDDKEGCNNYDFYSYKNGIFTGNMRTWVYQTCTEFGYFQSAESDNQMFGRSLPVDFCYKVCQISFGDDFNEGRVDRGVKNTNEMYQGLTPAVDHVVFVNGDMDPWHKLGILHDLSPEAPSIYITGSSHCHDLNTDPSDSDNINEARRKIKSVIVSWLEKK